MPYIQDYMSRCGITIERDAPGTPGSVTVAVDTWLSINNAALSDASLIDDVENHFTCDLSTGEISATFSGSRILLFSGSAQVSSSVNNTNFLFGLFRNAEADPITGLFNPIDLTTLGNKQSVSANRLLTVSSGDVFRVKFKADKACTIDIGQFGITLKE